MLTLLIRTLLIYTILIAIMRLMGKRQLGELEITDLVTTLLISEIASLPLTEESIPLHHAVIPVLTLALLEVGASALLLKLPAVKRLLMPRPTLLLLHGVPDRTAMKKARLSCEELLSQLRLKEIYDPQDVAFAVMEPNGQISVIPEAESEGPPPSRGMLRLIISDGGINHGNLRLIGKDTAWLETYLKRRGYLPREVFMLLSDGELTRLYPMHPTKKQTKKGTP
jgi:uncharacterized membrane protein YcaP (DUF421 family)